MGLNRGIVDGFREFYFAGIETWLGHDDELGVREAIVAGVGFLTEALEILHLGNFALFACCVVWWMFVWAGPWLACECVWLSWGWVSFGLAGLCGCL